MQLLFSLSATTGRVVHATARLCVTAAGSSSAVICCWLLQHLQWLSAATGVAATGGRSGPSHELLHLHQWPAQLPRHRSVTPAAAPLPVAKSG